MAVHAKVKKNGVWVPITALSKVKVKLRTTGSNPAWNTPHKIQVKSGSSWIDIFS